MSKPINPATLAEWRLLCDSGKSFILCHDDPPCREPLDGNGKCRKCDYSPDMQSIRLLSFRTAMPTLLEENERQAKEIAELRALCREANMELMQRPPDWPANKELCQKLRQAGGEV